MNDYLKCSYTSRMRLPVKIEKSELFVVGRIDRQGRRLVFVNEPAKAPFPGPWELHAVITI